MNVETKLIPELFGCLWVANKKLKVSAFELILERAMLPQLRPIVQQLMLKDNAVVPLISNIIDKNCDINLLSLTLTVLKYSCYDCKPLIELFSWALLTDTLIAQLLTSEFSQIGGVEAAKRLVEFLSSPEPRVQSGALELIGVFIKGACHMRRRAEDIIETNLDLFVPDPTMAPVWQQADLYQAALAAYKSEQVVNKLSALELLRCLVYRKSNTRTSCPYMITNPGAETDIENKRKFLEVVGLDELKKLLLREADLAVHAVRIIHCLCLPLVPEVRNAG